MTLVRMPNEGHCKLDKHYNTRDFFEKDEDGEWKVIDYKATCEYCGKNECDRMEFWEELDYDYDQMYHDESKENNEKRKFMYRSHIYIKHGYLDACVCDVLHC